jgi:hypothetical protein
MNGLRSTTSQKLQAVLDFQDPSRLRRLVHLHPRPPSPSISSSGTRSNWHCTPVLLALTASGDTIGNRPIFWQLTQNVMINDQASRHSWGRVQSYISGRPLLLLGAR